jgi:hypothetical protein
MSVVLNALLFEGWIYLLLFIIFLFHALIDLSVYREKYSHILSIIGVLLMVCLLSLRWNTGTDWEPYYELFLDLKKENLLDIYHFDIGYVIWNKIIGLFTSHYTVFLFLNSFLAFTILYYLIRRISVYPNISLYLLFCIYLFAHFMGGNRRMIAIAFVLLCIYFISLQQKKKALLFLLFAFLFHRSSLFCGIAFFIPQTLFQRKYIVSLVLLSIFLGVTQIPFKLIAYIGGSLYGVVNLQIVDLMAIYTDKEYGYVVENINPVTQAIMGLLKRSFVLFIIYYSFKISNIDKLCQYFINLYLIGFAVYFVFIGSSVLQVLSTYFAILEVFVLSNVFINYSKNQKLYVFAILLVYGFLQLMNSFTAYPELFIPYKSIFSYE